MGEIGSQGAQRLLKAARQDADAVGDDLRSSVIAHLDDEDSRVLIVDETGFLKSGEKSVGVARRYTGTAGRIESAQVRVYLVFASRKGAAFTDRALYLSREEGAEDTNRRAESRVSEEIGLENKGGTRQTHCGGGLEAKVPARWVVADSFYGRSHSFKAWLEERGCPNAVMVPKTNAVELRGRKKKMDELVERLPNDAWAPVARVEIENTSNS